MGVGYMRAAYPKGAAFDKNGHADVHTHASRTAASERVCRLPALAGGEVSSEVPPVFRPFRIADADRLRGFTPSGIRPKRGRGGGHALCPCVEFTGLNRHQFDTNPCGTHCCHASHTVDTDFRVLGCFQVRPRCF